MKQLVKNMIRQIFGIKTHDYLAVLQKKGLRVGSNFTMRDGCIIDFSHSFHITIGDNVTLAPRVHIIAHDASTWEYLGYTKVKNVTIGNKVFIGAGSIILPGVTIGNNVIVGAGSVVSKDIPENSVCAGNPAKFIMHTNDYILREQQKMNSENCFDSSFSEAQNATAQQKNLIRQMAAKYGSSFVQ